MLLELKGTDLLGTPLASPRAAHARVYVLPLLTILTNKVRAGAQARRRRRRLASARAARLHWGGEA